MLARQSAKHIVKTQPRNAMMMMMMMIAGQPCFEERKLDRLKRLFCVDLFKD